MMGLLVVDESKCRREQTCAEVCPSRIISFEGKNGFPEIPEKLEKGCILCGHCVSVCPYGALSHKDIPLESCPPIQPDLTLNEAQAEQFLRTRRSVRAFRDQTVEKEKLQRLIGIARYAPTGGNFQRLAWRVVTDRELLTRTADLTAAYLKQVMDTKPRGSYPVYYPAMVAGHRAGRDPITRQAPVLLIVSNPPMVSNGMVDIALTLAYLELVAPIMGLGTCWAGLVTTALMKVPEVRDLLGVPENHPNVYSMLLGYPRHRFQRMPERRLPKIDWL